MFNQPDESDHFCQQLIPNQIYSTFLLRKICHSVSGYTHGFDAIGLLQPEYTSSLQALIAGMLPYYTFYIVEAQLGILHHQGYAFILPNNQIKHHNHHNLNNTTRT